MKQYHAAAIVVSGIIFTAVYKIAAWHYFSGQPHIALENATSYGGVASGEWGGFVQTKEETCGHAALAFFLSGIGLTETETTIIRETGTSGMLSLADMEMAGLYPVW
jgi:hypothetical protein